MTPTTESLLVLYGLSQVYDMVDERDIHKRKRRIGTVLQRIKKSDEILQENAETIRQFNDHLKTVRSLKVDRRHFYLNRISTIAKWVEKPFKEMEKRHVKKIQARIEEKDYTEWTKHDYLTALKKFFQWLHRDELDGYSWKSKDYPDIVKNVDTSVGKDAHRLPNNLPEREEVEKMVNQCKNSRDKAILMTLFDGGFRVGEFLNMEVGHLNQMDRGVSVSVHGKTGSRQVLMPMAEPHLNKWLDDHPCPENGSYLWVNVGNHRYGAPLSYQSLRKRLKVLRKRADLDCKVNPHAFRKASATFYAQHLNEVQLCDRYGWVYGSDTPRIYIKKSGKRTNNAVLKAHGIKTKEKQREKQFKPENCSRCGEANPHDAERCRNCGMLLDKAKVTQAENKIEDRVIKMIQQNPEKWGSVLLDALQKSKNKAES